MSQGMLGNLPLSEVRGPKGDLDEKLAGPDGGFWLTALKRYLRKENPWASFLVRWRVTLGVLNTPKAHKIALESNGFRIGPNAREILNKVRCSKAEAQILLTSATVAELGLSEGGTTQELHSAILAKGGQLCPAEVGPDLRLSLIGSDEYRERLFVAMKAISGSDNHLYAFVVESIDDGLWLNAYACNQQDNLDPGDRIVFVVPA